MLRAFLIVWTLVAGVAAGSLMYIVRGGQEAPVVSISPAKDKSAAVTAPAAPAAPAPVSTTGWRSPETPVADQNVPAEAGPASTGSIAPGRNAPRPVRRVDEGLVLPSGGADTAAKTAQEQPATSAVRNDTAAAPGEKVLPPARPAAPAQGSSARTETAALPALDDAEADPAAPRAHVPSRVAGKGAADRPSNSGVTTTVPPSPPIVSEQTPDRPRPKADVAPRPRERDVAARSEPDDASVQAQAAQANRALKQQARLMEQRAAREAERNRTRAAAATDQEPVATARPRLAETRRQARLERRTRVARGDGLEELLDEFSRSGADYLHERTIRVGTRYLVERTTRQGTQYFYDQSVR
jgi:hypothetical protein